jgi:site-specific DNA-methyltransferase (adenine-specific)
MRADIDITDQEFKEWVFGRWVVPPETRMKDFGHPAMFPEEIPRRLLKLFSYQNDIVLDPFNGAGTTTLAAWRNNRRFIGIEISPEYCREALDRIARSGVISGTRPESDIRFFGSENVTRK